MDPIGIIIRTLTALASTAGALAYWRHEIRKEREHRTITARLEQVIRGY